MTFLELATLGGLTVWVAVVIGRGLSGARFNRALRAYVELVDAIPASVVAPVSRDHQERTRAMACVGMGAPDVL